MLWDEEFSSAMPRIEQLSADRRYAAAVATIDHTLTTFDPPVDADEPAAQLLLRCLVDSRASVGGDHTGRILPDGAAEQMSSIIAEGAQPGVAPLIMAVANCYGIPDSGMAAEHLYTVLSDCYSAVVDHEELEDDTLEEELANPRCVAMIAWQKELISS